MTGENILKRALSFMLESPNEDEFFKKHALELINALIAECLPAQNSRRKKRKQEEIETLEISDLSEEVSLDEIFTRVIIPHGLVSIFYHDEFDLKRAELYRERFEIGLYNAKQYLFEEVFDAYGGEI